MDHPLTPEEIETASTDAAIGTKLVFADHAMSIWHLHLKPDQTLDAHRHDGPYFWTVLSGGVARSRDGEGRVPTSPSSKARRVISPTSARTTASSTTSPTSATPNSSS